IGQMMEPVALPPQRPRRTDEEVREQCPWATTGRRVSRKPNIITSLELKPEAMEANNLHLQEKYKTIRDNEVRYETQMCEDAEYLVVAFGSAARIAESAIREMRADGIKAGLFRPITVWPFPEKELREVAKGKKFILVAEINAGQMIQDVRLSVGDSIAVHHYGRLGGMVPEPKEIIDTVKNLMK
ncbi:MAG: 3-methyl-2-oxobutanoate dehydrogenase subunit beta, partial [Prevotella sp.]|nr:3-methyl-2-oxobutanoate dehydrogenase subunit beta [Candidatus Prevotella equi]